MVCELHTLFDETLSGTDEKGNRCLIKPAEVFSFYAEGQRVFAQRRESLRQAERPLPAHAGKAALLHRAQRAREVHRGQIVAAAKGVLPDRGHGLGQRDRL